jgi:hypothetical protein
MCTPFAMAHRAARGASAGPWALLVHGPTKVEVPAVSWCSVLEATQMSRVLSAAHRFSG